MSVAIKTTKKKYKTTEVHAKRIDAKINRITFGAICRCNHLTPASEAKMENLLVPGSAVVPKIAETIERNSPGFEPAVCEPAVCEPEDEDVVALLDGKSLRIAPLPKLDDLVPSAEAYDFD